jgi:hypothetical protein
MTVSWPPSWLADDSSRPGMNSGPREMPFNRSMGTGLGESDARGGQFQ